MRHFLYLWFPLWTAITAACFVVFVGGFFAFGLIDEIYGDFLGWIVFCVVTLINAIVTFSARWCYHTMKHYTWLTLLGAVLVWMSHSWLAFDVRGWVIGINLVFCFLGGREIWITWKCGRLHGMDAADS